MNIKDLIKKDIEQALIKINNNYTYKVLIISSKKKEFGQYQLDNLIKLSNILYIKPNTLYKKIINFIQKKNVYKKITFSPPGFINFFIENNWLSKQLEQIFLSSRLGIKHLYPKKNIIVDYSSPNIAKEMHVGHLRSTIIGDVTVRVLEFLGQKVIRANHIGDWGTQFGILIAYLEEKKLLKKLNQNLLSLKDLEEIYCKSKIEYECNQSFSKKSRLYVVKLQNGDPWCLSIWKKLVAITMLKNYEIYKKLNVTLTEKHTVGESFYNHMLENVVKDLQKKKIACKKNGTTIVVLNEFQNRTGQSMGVIIQKKDKGFLYATTDIACIKYRYQHLHANRIIYYTDSRQHQHLLQSWTIAQKAHYIPKDLLLEHHMFGMMLCKNKKPFKTRDGNTIKLSSLLNESINRAINLIKKKKPNLRKKKLIKLGNVIGISAVKYSDLSKNRTTNYIFDWEKMLSFEGNTAPYIQYAYTRIISILKKSTIPLRKIKTKSILNKDSEINLAIKILEFEEVILLIAQHGTPHIMCKYLYELSTCFSNFYEHCSVLFCKKIAIRKSRLKLSLLTARTIKKGLYLLGIKTVKEM